MHRFSGKYSTTPYDKLKLDLTYIENYTFALDLMIIIQTVKILFQKENSEGLDTGQKTACVRRTRRIEACRGICYYSCA